MTKGGNRGNRAPVYSADTLALRIFFGIALAALGVVIFMAVVMRLSGNVFEGLRNFCFGFAGGMAALLPILPLWAGILLIWSSQSKAPVRPLLWASLAYAGLCTFIVLVTRVGNQSLLGYLTGFTGKSWGNVIQEGFRFSMKSGQSGGALGILLGWPLQQLLGDILPAAILLILTILALLMAVNLSPRRIRDLVTGRVSFRRSREEAARQRAGEEQLAWQQQQAAQNQAAWQQAMLQQQQAAQQAAAQQAAAQQAAAQQAAAQQASVRQSAPGAQAYTAPQGYTANQPYTAPRTGAGPLPDDGGVAEWQAHLADQQAGRSRGKGGKSQILDRPAEQADQGEQAPGRNSFMSRIFHRDVSDGLNDASSQEKERQAREAQEIVKRAAQVREARAQAAGKTAAARPEQNADAPAQAGAGRSRMSSGDQEAYRRPQAEPAREKAGQAPRTGAEAPERPRAEGGKAGAWRSQLEDAEKKAAGMTAEAPARPAERPDRGSTPVPAVQQKIGEETWKPELNHVNAREEEAPEEFWTPTPYYAPSVRNLRMPEANTENTAEEDMMRSRRLEETLESFNVIAKVVHVTHGPAISRFELELASGTKVSKVAGLEKDIAYGMQATSVRIEAPIPGKSLVGVEVPNRKVSLVTLREVLESPAMQNAKSILTVALGKDIAGTPVVCDLARMPHMLIAGATGSGKSVCINTIINSLLFRAGPDEVKLILVDPKVVELQVYNNIPHLLIPVVSDPHKAAAALAWAVAEMMDRYDRFARRKVRNLDGYNNVLEEGEKPMPRIVIIIDELADLMMVCKKDVEEYICRLTQLARAAGIHLIVATQRPSVDVITGLIKANIPSRIAFKTASYVDSRTILDRNGSEQLLGYGDMLYLPTGSFSPTRIQGCFLSDEEVNLIAADVKRANPSSYDQDILDKLDELSSDAGETPGMDMIGGAADTAADGSLFEQAVEYAIADGQISTSTLQRRLKVGYARAGRLTDEMEERGIVSAKDGSKPRKCLITREQWEEMKRATEGMS